MAEIFLARALGIEGFERLVVLKRILPQYASDSRFIRMFLQEARVAATLHHTNIAQVYDIGRVSGSYFFAMEYIHGIDLRQLLRAAKERDESIPLDHALFAIIGAAAGLHHAHEKRGQDGEPLGLVHRDVSPSNVLLGYDGGVKVVDFGIAKATHQRSETRPGTVKGKVAYMSPEQCLDQPLDRRSDVFSLGVLLFELTTGTFLFDGSTEVAVMRQVVDCDIPRPSTRCPGYPPQLERIVLRALEKDPNNRFTTAYELQSALEGFARSESRMSSALAMARYLEDLCGTDIAAWRRAQEAGQSLVDFVSLTSIETRARADGLTPTEEDGWSETTPLSALLEEG